jgi:CPA2 family monovalent cation:H+ antiporter-2
MGLAQIGEFSFIIAALGVSLKVTSDFLYPVAVAVSAITTLLTPYLIRASDPLARWLGRHVPAWLRQSLGLYTEWLQSIQPTGQTAALAAIVWRILAHVAVNMMLIAAIFFGMAYFSDHVTNLLGTGALGPRYRHAILWAAALALSLPFLIATYRKLKALGMLLAELGVPQARAGRHTPRVRAVLAEVFPVLSLLLMFLLISALSSSLLPPVELLVAAVAGVALLGALLWRRMVVLHARLQIALREGLSPPTEEHKP